MNIIDNISLVVEKEYHFLHSGCKDQVLQYLTKFSLQDIAYKHHSSLSDRDYFIVQLIRASMIKENDIIIDAPFALLTLVQDIRIVKKMFEILDIDFEKLMIIDYISELSKYKEEVCHIEKCL